MKAFDLDPETDEALGDLARRWWLLALLGAVTALLGALILIRPVAGEFALAVLIALALAVSGLSQIAASSRWPRRWVPVVWGVLSLVAAVIAAVWPAISLFALAVVIGLGLILRGLISIGAALGDRPSFWGAWLVLGVLEVAVGIAAVIWPGITILVLALLIGVDLLLVGLMELAAAVRLRSWASAGSGSR